MKITAKRLKEIIMEEFNALSDGDILNEVEADPEALALETALASALEKMSEPEVDVEEVKREIEAALR